MPFHLTAGANNQVSASIGIALYPTNGADGGTMLKHADIAMYAAKAAGKGRYHFFNFPKLTVPFKLSVK